MPPKGRATGSKRQSRGSGSRSLSFTFCSVANVEPKWPSPRQNPLTLAANNLIEELLQNGSHHFSASSYHWIRFDWSPWLFIWRGYQGEINKTAARWREFE